MNILILGSGGREHALARKISESPLCEKLFIAPGNAGTSLVGSNINMGFNDFEAIKQFSLTNTIGMIVVGPEEPLVNGIVDFFNQQNDCAHILVLGPDKAGAQLEGSKAWSKVFMHDFNIPTASYREFNSQTREDGLKFIETCSLPIVLKADGLAAGKGVIITEDRKEAAITLNSMLGGMFGKAGNTVVIEQFLSGIEFSVFVLTDGKSYKLLPEAKDYKRIGEGDTGPNTGGMGAVSPVCFVTEAMMEKVKTKIIEPTINGLQSRKIDYRGFIFFGLIKVNDVPYVIEYNCRMGDPETEVVIPRITNDLVPFLENAAKGQLGVEEIMVNRQTATTIMLVSGGYPGDYNKGETISGIENIKNSIVFHAGTLSQNGKVLTNGGRVIAITSFGSSIEEAIKKSLDSAEKLDFKGKQYRKDIGEDLMKYVPSYAKQ